MDFVGMHNLNFVISLPLKRLNAQDKLHPAGKGASCNAQEAGHVQGAGRCYLRRDNLPFTSEIHKRGKTQNFVPSRSGWHSALIGTWTT